MKLISINNLSFEIRENTTDEKVIPEVIGKNIYLKRPAIQIRAKEKWLDLGANIGAFTVLAASQGAEVTAFEPEQQNFDLLENNIKLNNLTAKTVRAAVNASGAPAKLYLCKTAQNKYRHTLKPIRGRSAIDIQIMSFADVIKQYNPCGIKLDIEGAEIEILDSKPELHNVERIAMEYHFDHDYSVANFRNRMRIIEAQGFTTYYSAIPDTILEYKFFPASKIVIAIRNHGS